MNFVVDLKSIVVLPATIVLGKHFFDNARACISVEKNFGKIFFFFCFFMTLRYRKCTILLYKSRVG